MADLLAGQPSMPVQGKGAFIDALAQALQHTASLPQRALGAAGELQRTGEYDPGPVTDVALHMVGAPGVPRGALGSSVGKLPMDEASRMSRAKDLGYTIDAYKGMYPYDWRTVPERDWNGNVIKGTENRVPQEIMEIDAGKSSVAGHTGAGFFSNSPDVASRFATVMGEGAVFPTKLRMTNPKVIDAKGAFAADFQFGPGAGRLKLPADSPHDGVILKNTKDEGDVYIPKESSQIRSRFAAFDPANEGSGLLLGSLALSPWLAQALQGEQ